MKTKKSVTTYLILVIAAIILVNILSDQFFFRLDFTKDNRYTLSKATKDILKSLEEPVTITAYFSENLPADAEKIKRDFKEILVEYSTLSKGNVMYEFINPNEDEQAEMKAMQEGVQPGIIDVTEKDKHERMKVFMGAVIQFREQKGVIPFIQPGAAMEYDLSSNIKKMIVTDKPVIGILQGHGEPGLHQILIVNNALSILYTVEPVYMNDTTPVLDKYSTVAIIAPADSFPASHLQQLDRYLAAGKNLLIAINRVKGDFSTAMGSTVNTGLETWLSNKGITIGNSFIVDASCANVTVPQGPFSMVVPFPYIPFISNFEQHPITRGLEKVFLQFASPITYSGDSAVQFIPLAKTSEKSGTQTSPTYFDVRKQFSDADFTLPRQTVAALIKGKIAGSTPSRMVVFGDGDFPIDKGDARMQNQYPDNFNLMVNAIDFLTDETGLIDLRTKLVTSHPLDEVEEGRVAFLKYLNFLLPILLIVIYGIIRVQYTRNLKNKRMEEGYV